MKSSLSLGRKVVVLIQNTVKNATEEMDKIVEEAISPGANPKNQYNI
jgi:low affinity Fe/Cu permease